MVQSSHSLLLRVTFLRKCIQRPYTPALVCRRVFSHEAAPHQLKPERRGFVLGEQPFFRQFFHVT